MTGLPILFLRQRLVGNDRLRGTGQRDCADVDEWENEIDLAAHDHLDGAAGRIFIRVVASDGGGGVALAAGISRIGGAVGIRGRRSPGQRPGDGSGDIGGIHAHGYQVRRERLDF